MARLESRLERLEQRPVSPVAVPGKGGAPEAATEADDAVAPAPVSVAEEALREHQPIAVDVPVAAAGEAATLASEAPAPEAPTRTPPTPARQASLAAEQARTDLPARPASPLWDRLLRGNLMARAGVIVLFFGVAFLLKYTYQHVQVPIELRLAGVALAAVVLLLIGWRLRLTREGYGLSLIHI